MPKVRIVRVRTHTEAFHMECVSIHEVSTEIPDSTTEPYAMLRAKAERLAELLDCTPDEAERVILARA